MPHWKKSMKARCAQILEQTWALRESSTFGVVPAHCIRGQTRLEILGRFRRKSRKLSAALDALRSDSIRRLATLDDCSAALFAGFHNYAAFPAIFKMVFATSVLEAIAISLTSHSNPIGSYLYVNLRDNN